MGFAPPHLVCYQCGERFTGRPDAGAWLSATEGVLTSSPCAEGRGAGPSGARLSPDALWFLALARQNGPRELAELMVAGPVLAELAALHRLLMGRHLERALKSLSGAR